MPKLCLSMIVKNETHIIKECLDSIHKYVDYWVIVDTGSTDGTQELKNLKGDSTKLKKGTIMGT